MEFKNIAEGFVLACTTHQKPDALRVKKDGVWHDISSSRLLERVRNVTLALVESGVQKDDRVALLCENRPEWAIADYAGLCAAAATVPIYPTLMPDVIQYILENSEAKVLFVSTPKQLEKVAPLLSSLPNLKRIVVMDGPGDPARGIVTFEAFEKTGADRAATDTKTFDERRNSIRPDDLITLIYTSGTTGMPKGVMLTHANIVFQAKMTPTLIPFDKSDVVLSFLPLSHIFERMVDYAFLLRGITIAYAESIDTVAANLPEVRPTIMAAVPRFYEKLYDRIHENVRQGSGLKQKIFRWAVATGKERTKALHAGTAPGFFLDLKYAIATKLVFSKFAARTGGRMRFFISGGAPLAREIAEFFHAAGLPIYEGYGLTETSPVISVNHPGACRLGTVGKVAEGVEVRIAEDGEILCKGPGVMRGYYKMEKETGEVIRDGWFHTGDIGHLDPDGYLVITDRKKDLIKTSGGKYVAPQPIENKLKMAEYITNAVIVGNARKFISVLLVPDIARVESFAKEKGITYASPAELIKNDAVKALFDREMDNINAGLASYESIKKYALIEKDFTIEGGEITPTLKVKRKVVETKYKDVIDKMYEDGK